MTSVASAFVLSLLSKQTIFKRFSCLNECTKSRFSKQIYSFANCKLEVMVSLQWLNWVHLAINGTYWIDRKRKLIWCLRFKHNSAIYSFNTQKHLYLSRSITFNLQFTMIILMRTSNCANKKRFRSFEQFNAIYLWSYDDAVCFSVFIQCCDLQKNNTHLFTLVSLLQRKKKQNRMKPGK